MDTLDFSEWRDADFYDMPSQTTIHSLASLKTEKNTSKFLVSCMNCQFCSVEYQVGEKVTPLMRSIQFSSLPMPGDAEVVGISVFERLPPKQGHVVGLTYVIFDKASTPEHQESTPKSQFFNVYTPVDDGNDGDNDDDDGGKGSNSKAQRLKLEVIAENCQSLALTYIPFCLKNTLVKSESGQTEPVFLISGSDYQVHLYREETEQQSSMQELPTKHFFPEFQDMSGIAETIEIARPDATHRVTAIGFEEGPIEVYRVNWETLEIVNVWKTSLDAPITSLHFFTHRKPVPVPPCFEPYVDENGPGGVREEEEDPDFTHLHLLMTVHLQPAVVYRNVLNSGLTEGLTLPDSQRFDSALCSLALDVDFDGEHEVIVGTYGQELLVYKFFPTSEQQVTIRQADMGGMGGVLSTPPCGRRGGARRLTVSGAFLQDESTKHRHKSDESGGGPGEKGQDQHRKVKSQEDLMSMLTRERRKNAGGQSPGGGGGEETTEEEGTATGEGVVMRMTTLDPHYRLQWRRSFPCPIMALGGGDMMGDGVENLVVLTAFGIHILQPNIQKLMDLVTARLKQMEDSVNVKETGDEFHKLQIE